MEIVSNPLQPGLSFAIDQEVLHTRISYLTLMSAAYVCKFKHSVRLRENHISLSAIAPTDATEVVVHELYLEAEDEFKVILPELLEPVKHLAEMYYQFTSIQPEDVVLQTVMQILPDVQTQQFKHQYYMRYSEKSHANPDTVWTI